MSPCEICDNSRLCISDSQTSNLPIHITSYKLSGHKHESCRFSRSLRWNYLYKASQLLALKLSADSFDRFDPSGQYSRPGKVTSAIRQDDGHYLKIYKHDLSSMFHKNAKNIF